MDRGTLIRRLVLNQICDDYENVDQVILRDVAEMGAKIGTTIKRSDVVDALAGLIQDGLAKAYQLSGAKPPVELEGMPSMDVVEEDFKTYFWATKKGLDLHLSDGAGWPFDDDGNPR